MRDYVDYLLQLDLIKEHNKELAAKGEEPQHIITRDGKDFTFAPTKAGSMLYLNMILGKLSGEDEHNLQMLKLKHKRTKSERVKAQLEEEAIAVRNRLFYYRELEISLHKLYIKLNHLIESPNPNLDIFDEFKFDWLEKIDFLESDEEE